MDLGAMVLIQACLMVSGPGVEAAMMTSAPLRASSSVMMRLGLVASAISHLR